MRILRLRILRKSFMRDSFRSKEHTEKTAMIYTTIYHRYSTTKQETTGHNFYTSLCSIIKKPQVVFTVLSKCY